MTCFDVLIGSVGLVSVRTLGSRLGTACTPEPFSGNVIG